MLGPLWVLRMFLVVVDAHSKWVEVVQISSTTLSKTIAELWKLFSAYELPDQLVSESLTMISINL